MVSRVTIQHICDSLKEATWYPYLALSMPHAHTCVQRKTYLSRRDQHVKDKRLSEKLDYLENQLQNVVLDSRFISIGHMTVFD